MSTPGFSYDALDRLIEEIGFDGRIQHYHYNELGLLMTQDDGKNGQRHSIQYSYDDKDNLVQRRWGRTDTLTEPASPSGLPDQVKMKKVGCTTIGIGTMTRSLGAM